MPVHSLGYLHLDVVDLDEWRQFAGGFLGLQETAAADPETACFRLDGFHHRLAVTRAPAPRLRAAGFQVTDSRDLDLTARQLELAGITVHDASKDELARRKVTGLVRFDDPAGNPIELFYGPELDHSEVLTPGVSAFVTGDQGMGHIILNAPDVEACLRIYRDVLGFEERNTSPGRSGKLYFLGCNPRQHTLGLAPAPSPGLLHLMVEAATLDDVGRALDRARRHDIAMMQSLGRHTNDHMVSFYVWSPENIAVEFGYDGDKVTTGQPTYQITEGALWGHHFTPAPDRHLSHS
jgi:3,4-dihydroxy-9,10-secoandrosta-1,3,5(10)-triene-9,17-dione 4,5-dioxygenase